MSTIDENYNYLVNVVLVPLGISESDFPDLREKMEKGDPYFICSKKLAKEEYTARFDFKFEKNASRPEDLRYFLNEIRAILRPIEGMTQLKVFKLFRQKGKNPDEMESEMKCLYLQNSNQKINLPDMTRKLLSKEAEPNNKKLGNRIST